MQVKHAGNVSCGGCSGIALGRREFDGDGSRCLEATLHVPDKSRNKDVIVPRLLWVGIQSCDLLQKVDKQDRHYRHGYGFTCMLGLSPY